LKSGFFALTIISSLILLLGVLFLFYYIYVLWVIYHFPKDNPYNYVKKLNKKNSLSKRKRIVFIGDSLTHANLSVNYINIIKKELGDAYDYINAGMNAELAYNVLLRIDSIIACNPDFITILIGTNDANRELKPVQDKRSVKRLKLPQKPNKKWFKGNLIGIIEKLKEKTNAKIALCSIPIISEEPTSRVFQQSIDYSRTIKEIATKEQVTYIPFNERLNDFLKENPSNPKHPYEKRLVETAAAKHFLLRKSLDKISDENGFSLLVDHIHLNSTGASILANQIIDFISD
jgi:lysophospholipase L1-like esterase